MNRRFDASWREIFWEINQRFLRKGRLLAYILPLVLLAGACAHRPRFPNPQYTWQNYKFAVMLAPELLNDSPKLDLGLSLVQMEYPPQQAEYFKQAIYGAASIDDYTQQIIREQREIYRSMAPATELSDVNWSRSEKTDIYQAGELGIIVMRDLTVYSGGAYANKTKRYYVLDMGSFKQLKIDDLFASFHEEIRIRDMIYDELRKYSNLAWGMGLSQGIYFSNEPEISFNFFLTEEGLGLHWDPEQIAPYEEGEIEIILPWQTLRPLMLYTGIQLLGKFNLELFTYTPGEIDN